jgi:sugar lactone lactonase YvrE
MNAIRLFPTRFLSNRPAKLTFAAIFLFGAGAVGLWGQSDYATPYTFSTLAGKARAQGLVDGTGDGALFHYPQGVAVDGNGNVYVADTYNSCIRKITSAGVVTTFLNIGASAIAVDSEGNLFIAAGGITKATSSGVLTTITPQMSSGGMPLSATGIAVGSDGLIYAADGPDDLIFTVSQLSGASNVLAGMLQQFGHQDGTGSAAHFTSPSGVAVDASGNVYVTDTGNDTIRKIAPGAVVTTLAGTAGTSGHVDGTGSGALFEGLNGITIDASGNLYVTSADNTIRECTSAGVVTTLAGTTNVSGSADGTGAAALFYNPIGIAVDASGDMFVADSFNDTIRERYAAPYSQPSISTQPVAASVVLGASATFTVAASGVPAANFQWLFDGTIVPGGTNASLTVTNVQATNLGSYSVIVSSDAGSVTSNAAALSSPGVTPIPPAAPQATAFLSNISTRAQVGTGAAIEIAGFVVTGPPGSTEQVLIRAVGEGLDNFQIVNWLSLPVLTLFDSSGAQIATNTGWSTNSNAAQIAAAAASIGTFALSPPIVGYGDSALLLNLPPGSYTAQVSGAAGGTGIALAEVYEVNGPGAAQFSNISTRASVSNGQAVAIGGITISGTQPMKVLIRAVGPTLANFSVDGALAAPTLTVVDSAGNSVATNAGWSTNANAAEIVSAAAAVGAFALPSGSADCAVLLTLNPGSYTAIVSAPTGGAGIALVEAYQAP